MMSGNDSLLRHLGVNVDARGHLVALESGMDVPFQIRRVYYIYGVHEDVERGFHAHKRLRQLMICISGACTVTLDDGDKRQDYRLDDPSVGLYVDRMMWREMRAFTANCVLLVLASEPYEREDYIFSYEEFSEALRDSGAESPDH